MGVDYPLELMLATPQVHAIRGVGRKQSSSAVPTFFKDHVAAHLPPTPPTPPTDKLDFSLLPRDVRHTIITEVAYASPRRFLPWYATVSREWQEVIERITFADLYLTDGRVSDFGNVMNPRRQSNLRYIMCHVMLGLYASHNARETASQHRESTRVLNDYMVQLLTTMSKWRVEDAGPAGIQLKIVVNSPSDEPSSSYVPGDHRQSRRARAALARIDVPSESLPVVHVISGLSCAGRHVELASVTLLVTKLPNLMTLDVEMEHDTRDHRDVEQRAEFISSLAYYAPNMAHLRLHRPINHVESTKSPSREQRALFHTRLRNFTQRCATVGFDDCVYAREFLAPFANDFSSYNGNGNGHGVDGAAIHPASNSLQPYRNQASDLWWPTLRKLHIRNSYMLRRPYMRVTTRSAALMIIHEVLLLAGRAVAHMPALEEVRIRQYVLASGRLETILIEYKAGSMLRTTSTRSKKTAPRLKVKGLRPSVPTIEAWKESVRSTRGSHLVIELDSNMDY